MPSYASMRVTAGEIAEGVVADVEQESTWSCSSGGGQSASPPVLLVELAPHALVRLSEGDRTEWTVTETVRALVVSLPG